MFFIIKNMSLELNGNNNEKGGGLNQPHPGAQIHCYRCSLPGLAEFTAYCREGTDKSHHNNHFNLL